MLGVKEKEDLREGDVVMVVMRGENVGCSREVVMVDILKEEEFLVFCVY